MPITANNRGAATGFFDIPANIPSGTKLVQLLANTNAGLAPRAQANYTGTSVVVRETLRRLVTVTTTFYDPLAQTFALTEGRWITGVDVIFQRRGSTANDAQVEIREVVNGVPGRDILAQGVLPGVDIPASPNPNQPNQNWSRIPLEKPVWLDGEREYAIVLLTDDPTHAVAVAQLGKYDSVNQAWIAAQPYSVGVLLSSSNASTWTPHQDQDMTFRLVGAKFTQSTRTVSLGTVQATSTTDILTLANIEKPTQTGDVVFTYTRTNNDQITAQDDQNVELAAALSDVLTLTATITGTEKACPMLMPGVQTALGVQASTATYVSRAITAGTNVKIAVTVDVLLPGTAGLVVEAKSSTGTWLNVPYTTGQNIGDGWEERTFVLTPFTAATTQIRLTLSGTAQYRPRVRNLRAVIV